MLYENDSRTQHVLRAAALEDEVRAHLAAIEQSADGADRARRFRDIALRVVPELRRLNGAHFGSSRGIARHLDGIEAAALWEDAGLLRSRLGALADGPGDNFGTWAI